ncbi:MAG: preprotein translocase subunit YajC [Clostridia bacterium]|nr:preprotein translocase subunit YajC [Clostridia bacterium]
MDSQSLMSIGLIVVMFAAMYFLLIRPQKKKEKETQAMRDALRVGDEVITIGGIHGKIVKTKDESLVLAVGADKVKMEFEKWAISQVSEKSASDDFEEEAPKAPKRLKKKESTEE